MNKQISHLLRMTFGKTATNHTLKKKKMVEIPKAICEIGIGEPDFDGSAMLKTVISDQEGFVNRNERSANVVLDIERLDEFTDKKKDLSSSPKSTRSLSRKGSYHAEKKIYESEVDETSKPASTKGWGLNILPDKCVVVPGRREVSSSGEGSMRWRRYFNKRNLWADPRRILFIFATLDETIRDVVLIRDCPILD